MRNLVPLTLKFKKLLELQRKCQGTLEISVPPLMVSETLLSSTAVISFHCGMLYVLCLMGTTKDSVFHRAFVITAIFFIDLRDFKKLLELNVGKHQEAFSTRP